MACDESVVNSGVNASLYADALLKVVERTLSSPFGFEATLFASRKNLERRVNAIMNKESLNSHHRQWVFIALPLAMLCAAAWFIGSA